MNIFRIILLIGPLIFSFPSYAQTTITIGTGTTSGTAAFVSLNIAAPYTSRQKALYGSNEIIAAGGINGFISKVRWNNTNGGGYNTNNGILRIYMYSTSLIIFPTSEPWIPTSTIGGLKKVFEKTNVNIPFSAGWLEFTLDSLFYLKSGSNLVVMTEFIQLSNITGNAPSWQFTVSGNRHCFAGNQSTVGAANLSSNSSRPNMQFDILTECTPKVEASIIKAFRWYADSVTVSVSNAQPGYEYTWRPGTGLSAVSGTQIKAAPSVNTTYYLRGYDPISKCTSEDTFSIHVVDSNSLSVKLESCACPAQSIANDVMKFSNPELVGLFVWQKKTGGVWVNETGPTATAETHTPTGGQASEYRVKVSIGSYVYYTNVVRTTNLTLALSPAVTIGKNFSAHTFNSISGVGGLFDAINCSGLSANTIAVIHSDIKENGARTLKDQNNGYTLQIKSDSNRVVSGKAQGGLLVFDGADSVILGDTSSLSILTIQNDTAGSTIVFQNAASYNRISNCILTSGGASVSVVAFGSTNTTSGNNYNEISNCVITKRNGSTILNGIYSSGNPAFSPEVDEFVKANRFNKILNNRIYDFYQPGSTAAGIHIGDGNSHWILSGNHIYQTAARALTLNTILKGININTPTGRWVTISGNVIGGSGPGASGTWVVNGSGAGSICEVRGIDIALGTGLGIDSRIECRNNTIKNFRIVPEASGKIAFAGIYVSKGDARLYGNTIGDEFSDTSIQQVFSLNNAGNVYGIYTNVPWGSITKNRIAGFKLSGASPLNASAFGIYAGAGVGIDSNIITHFYSERSGENTMIAINGESTVTANEISSIYVKGDPVVGLKGIGKTGSGIIKIAQNKIHGMTTETGTNNFEPFNVLTGIYSTSNDSSNFEFNEIFNLKAKNSGTTQLPNVVNGFWLDNQFAKSGISGNKMYDLENTSTHNEAAVHGIGTQESARLVIYNNMISLSPSTDVTTMGIFAYFPQGASYIYHNSILIGNGTLVSGTKPSYVFYAQFEVPSKHLNNIYVNRRTGAGNHYTCYGKINAFYSDYNVFYSADTSKLFSNTVNDYGMVQWRILRGGSANADGHSFVFNPLFKSATDLHMDTTNCIIKRKGIAINFPTTDIDGEARNTPRDFGADEFGSEPLNPVLSGGGSICKAADSINLKVEGVAHGVIYWLRNGLIQAGLSGDSVYVSEPGFYRVVVTADGCNYPTNTVMLNYQPNQLTVLGKDTTICNTNSLVLDAGTGQHYRWNTGDTSRTLTVSESGTYLVVVQGGTCDGIDTIHVKYQPNHLPVLGNDTTTCSDDHFVLDAGVGLHYLWNTGDTSRTLAISQSGTYSVLVQGGTCDLIDTIDVTVLTSPSADFTYTVDRGKVEFNGPNQAGVLYHWDFGNGEADVIEDPVYHYTVSGLYDVTLTVTNANTGCESSSMQTLALFWDGVQTSISGSTRVYPNPFTNALHIEMDLQKESEVSVRILDVCGKLVEVVMDKQKVSGQQLLTWNSEQALPGFYLVCIETPDGREYRKVCLIK